MMKYSAMIAMSGADSEMSRPGSASPNPAMEQTSLINSPFQVVASVGACSMTDEGALLVASMRSVVSGRPSGYADCAERFSARSEEHTSELQSLRHLVCRLL